jgi:alpha-D-xyloside xylohydrolase
MPVEPIGADKDWAGDFRWILGRAFLVAPILDASGVRDVALPSAARWYDWWNDSADAKDGGTTLSAYDAKALDRVPLFVREGAIVPARVDGDLTGLGTAASKGALTLLVFPGPTREGIDVKDTAGALRVEAERTTQITVTLSTSPSPILLRVRTDAMPTQAEDGGVPLALHATRGAFDAATTGWLVDALRRITWVKLDARAAARTVILR